MTHKLRFWETNLYNFSDYLKKQGDTVEYGPLPDKATQKKVVDAAWWWAWRHKKTVRTKRILMEDGSLGVRVTLTREYRIRELKADWLDLIQ